MPTVSVVVPTRNRRESLTRLLQHLAKEPLHSRPSEVVVVDDGSTDDTAASVGLTQWALPVRVIRQDGSGAATARNTGARLATGDVLLFLDDDVEPEPGLIAAHAAAHELTEDIVALGDLPPHIEDRSYFGLMLRAWWGETQRGLRTPGHRYAFTDLLSGHFSIRRGQFERLGGFDERLRCREDYELGYRVIRAGLQMQFLPDAVARHHDSSDLAKAFRRKFDEGIADLQLLNIHPPLGCRMRLSNRAGHSRLQRLMIWLVWTSPATGRALAKALVAALPILERLNRRPRWRGVLNALLSYHYWRGVAAGIHSYAALEAQLRASSYRAEQPLRIDLSLGLDAVEACLEKERPRAVGLVFDDVMVGDVPDRPGEERLRGAHLRPVLAGALRDQYLRALAKTRRVPRVLLPAAAALTANALRKDREVFPA